VGNGSVRGTKACVNIIAVAQNLLFSAHSQRMGGDDILESDDEVADFVN